MYLNVIKSYIKLYIVFIQWIKFIRQYPIAEVPELCIVYCVLCIVIVIVQGHISCLPSPQVLEWVIMIMSVFDWDVLLLESISIV